MPQIITHDSQLDFHQLQTLCQKPDIFTEHTTPFWDDPHISQHMLDAHLNPDINAASYRPEIRDTIIKWIMESAQLTSGDSVLDLGCGPGLYCKRYAELGLEVTGMDMSENSIRYAREQDPNSTYINQNYLQLDTIGEFKAIQMISGDFPVLSPDDAKQLLQKVHTALQPSGMFIFDIFTGDFVGSTNPQPTYGIHPDGGFWQVNGHLVLQQVYTYNTPPTRLNQFVLVNDQGEAEVIRNWYQLYSDAAITTLLEDNGFEVVDIRHDLDGHEISPEFKWRGIVARKR